MLLLFPLYFIGVHDVGCVIVSIEALTYCHCQQAVEVIDRWYRGGTVEVIVICRRYGGGTVEADGTEEAQ